MQTQCHKAANCALSIQNIAERTKKYAKRLILWQKDTPVPEWGCLDYLEWQTFKLVTGIFLGHVQLNRHIMGINKKA